MIVIREAWRQGLFARRHWLPNIVAGVVVGLVALPLAMAFAIASGARPEQGIYTAIVAGLLVSTLGGSRVQIAGPTGAFVVILSSITATHGIAGLQWATLMAGVIMLLLGVARLGSIIRYIPDPVIVGFTAGIGIVIFVGQWKDFLGLPPVDAAHFHQRLWLLLQTLPHAHPATLSLAVLSLVIVVVAPKVPVLRAIPSPMTALLVATSLHHLLHLQGVATIGSAFGGIPLGLPSMAPPSLDSVQLIELIGPAFTIAMLGAIESLLSAVVADGMAGTRHDSNQELIGQGIANIAAPLFGGFAATGAIARTATNVRHGGTSPLAGIVHALTLVATIVLLAPLASGVPLCALAAILFVVAYNMSDWRHVTQMLRRAPRADVTILLVTLLLTVFADLVVAVNIGVILAVLHFVRRMSASVEVLNQDESALQAEFAAQGGLHLPPGVLVYAIDGPFFFGAVENFERALAQTHTDPSHLIIRLERVPFMDITAMQALEEVVRHTTGRGITVHLCGANPRVLTKLGNAGLLAMTRCKHADSLGEALRSCH
jgi:SulP family sulfate permease